MSVNDKVREFIEERLPPLAAKKAMEFLEQGFSLNGQMVITTIFLNAHMASKDLDEVLAALVAEWERNWNFQHPDIRANPDAPAAAGMQNRASLANICSALGLQNPAEAAQETA